MAELTAANDAEKSGISEKSSLGTGLAAAAVVVAGVALIEVEWVPAVLLGAAAMAFPKLVPSVARGAKPLLRTAMKAGYTATHRTREWMAEAGEQMSDMLAEVRAASMDPEPASSARPATDSAASATKAEDSGPEVEGGAA